jgi:hypothetical protein
VNGPYDDMSDDELIERILKLEESIKFYNMARKFMEAVIVLQCFRAYRKEEKASKSFKMRVQS